MFTSSARHLKRVRALGLLGLCCATAAHAQVAGTPAPQTNASDNTAVAKPATDTDAAVDQTFAFHAQATLVVQGNPAFHAAFAGDNSLRARGETRETTDFTVFAGVRPWRGAELWINPEIDQGFGLSNTLGAAGFPSGEAYKIGKKAPYFRLQRLFFRQTIGLGGEREAVVGDLNQLGGSRALNRIVVTLGKFGVGDIFDSNVYAHDPRADFLNWTLLDGGSFDYAADAWGYTTGGAVELYRGRYALRAGLFNLSKVPNSVSLERDFHQYQLIGEAEEDHTIGGRAGKLKITGYVSHGNMARLDDATALGQATGTVPDVALVRRSASRFGVSANLEQSVTDNLGIFARASIADGRYEAFEFTDVDRSFAAGLSLKGASWGRADDRIGAAVVINQASAARLRYLAAGGLGILIGDGALPHPGDEQIVEAYYDYAFVKAVHVTADFQLLNHPAYNRDRGPVAVFAARFHVQY